VTNLKNTVVIFKNIVVISDHEKTGWEARFPSEETFLFLQAVPPEYTTTPMWRHCREGKIQENQAEVGGLLSREPWFFHTKAPGTRRCTKGL